MAPTFLDANNAVTLGTYYIGANQPVAAVLATHDAGASWSVNRLPGTGSIGFESPLSGWQMNETLSSPWGGMGVVLTRPARENAARLEALRGHRAEAGRWTHLARQFANARVDAAEPR